MALAHEINCETGESAVVERVAPIVDLEVEAIKTRIERNRLLAESDWTQIADAPVDAAAWAVYRQALRDVPNQATFPENINWPQKPE